MATSEALGLVAHLRHKGIDVVVRDGKLCARPSAALTPEMRASIDSRRDEIVELLVAQQDSATLVVAEQRTLPALRTRLFPDCFDDMPAFARARGPHDPPARGCFCCGNREFVRVATGPAWFCPRCHPPLPGAEVIERMTAPEPSWREGRHA